MEPGRFLSIRGILWPGETKGCWTVPADFRRHGDVLLRAGADGETSGDRGSDEAASARWTNCEPCHQRRPPACAGRLADRSEESIFREGGGQPRVGFLFRPWVRESGR